MQTEIGNAGRTPPARVNSWDEWAPLRRIMVGRARGTMVQAPEPAVSRDWPEHGFPHGSFGPMPDDFVSAADAQLDHLAKLLTDRGVVVDRPPAFDFSQAVATPDWTQQSMFGCMPPRDVLIVVGNEILEATMSQRSRWFEYLCYRPLLLDYYRDDAAMRWEAAPKPRLTDASYHADFHTAYPALSDEEKIERVRANRLLLTEAEPLFDAADMVRFGKDLFVQLSMVTNQLGYRWLRDHFPDHRVHAVTFDNFYPQHIDATLVPLRPGLALHCGERAADPEMVEYFRLNDWQIVPAAKPARTRESLPQLCFCSQWLSMNLLSLDERTVFVEASEFAQQEQLDRLGFEVIPVPFWDVAPFGGGLHCATVDIERAGTMHDYFPRRHRRF
ncbi:MULTISPECIES: serine/threonine protein kinase [Burkholderia]|uniref:serine/threonine protein kinase n=1 Tax=Burkholderia TaxID=32008 RepID=UPI000BF161B8|nr:MULTISPECIES: serine/threonine protein kinase [Burkholderia]MBU9167235.1 serine/threonine protein kinase [Burkholderia gladioli]MBU9379088.1 serine/threonine protein kinase [Burkholderia gladioli]MDC6132947.1 serine/threonine protein kinase [Burkholderia gladioli]MDN7735388.1 serine/threonine protein kinase [Burkholderia gladioli]PEH83059.1 serine/threonine protein kinase [Burkholderia gladioli]